MQLRPLALLISAAVTCGLAAQARKQAPPVEVATLEDLRPTEPDQRTRARYFQWPSPPILEFKTIYVFPEPEREFGSFTPATMEVDKLRLKICRSAAVVVGQPVIAKTFLNQRETFLFTDFTVTVERWIRGERRKTPIMVSQHGGRAKVGELLLLETILGYLLEVGQQYVMFLGPIPETSAYRPVGYPMVVAGGKVLSGTVIGEFNLKDQEPYLKQMVTLASECKDRE